MVAQNQTNQPKPTSKPTLQGQIKPAPVRRNNAWPRVGFGAAGKIARVERIVDTELGDYSLFISK